MVKMCAMSIGLHPTTQFMHIWKPKYEEDIAFVCVMRLERLDCVKMPLLHICIYMCDTRLPAAYPLAYGVYDTNGY